MPHFGATITDANEWVWVVCGVKYRLGVDSWGDRDETGRENAAIDRRGHRCECQLGGLAEAGEKAADLGDVLVTKDLVRANVGEAERMVGA